MAIRTVNRKTIAVALFSALLLFAALIAHATRAYALPQMMEGSLRIYASAVPNRSRATANALRAGDNAENWRSYASNGDALLLEKADDLGQMHYALVDCGGQNAGEMAETLEWVKNHTRHLDWIVVTHFDFDHFGAVYHIIDDPEISVDRLYLKHFDNGFEYHKVYNEDGSVAFRPIYNAKTKAMAFTLDAAVRNGVEVVGISWCEADIDDARMPFASPMLYSSEIYRQRFAAWSADASSLFQGFTKENTSFEWCGIAVELFNWNEYGEDGDVWTPDSSTPHEWVLDENANSMGVLLRNGESSAFLAGDIEHRASNKMYKGDSEKLADPSQYGWRMSLGADGRYTVLRQASAEGDEARLARILPDVDLLKVGHHGSDTSSSQEFLDALKPEYAIITNVRGMAAEEVVDRLDSMGVEYLYTTDDDIEVVAELSFDGAVRLGRSGDPEWLRNRASNTTRIAGEGSLDTMAAAVRAAFEGQSPSAAVIVSALSYKDASSSAALAGTLDAPILMTAPNALSPQTASVIRDLGIESIYIVGGESAVERSVEDALRDMGLAVNRIQGATAQKTSLAVLEQVAALKGGIDEVFVVATADWRDALAASGCAYTDAAPILISDASGKLNGAMLEAIAKIDPSRVVIVGGEKAVPAETAKAIAAASPSASVERVGGANAVATAVALAEKTSHVEGQLRGMAVCTNRGCRDAVSSISLCGRTGAQLISIPSTLPRAVRDLAARMDSAVIVGGEVAVSPECADKLSAAIGREV